MYQGPVQSALESEAKSLWADPYPLTMDDRPFKVTDQHAIFVRHSITFGDGKSTSLGTGWYRYLGLQYLSVFYRSGEGIADVLAYGDKIVKHYTDLILQAPPTKVVFGVASAVKLPQDAKGFSQLQVVCPFYFDSRS